MHMFIKRLAIACFTLLSLGARGKIQQQAVSRTGRLSIFCRRGGVTLEPIGVGLGRHLQDVVIRGRQIRDNQRLQLY